MILDLNQGSIDDSGLRHPVARPTPSAPLQATENDDTPDYDTPRHPGDDDANVDVQNIPLQRIVQSKKQTKRPNNRVIREGWMVHYTDRFNMVRLFKLIS